ncbi:MAG: mannose-1-phosphate guanylyltransferase [Porphyromonadaceae bacterium]|nr:mannose-1-phosphate guanylyltransferase [Porphyromonadaceae bacterium]
MAGIAHLVIMAGGVGSRFWPMSTPAVPKQFLDITGEGRTLIQRTADRFASLVPPERMWVVTAKQYAPLVREQLPEIPAANLLLEPCMRNTAPCIAYAGWKIKAVDPEAAIVVSPADHVVTDVAEFRRVIAHSLAFVTDRPAILTLGMKPTRPETGYGYIAVAAGQTQGILPVESFREKPSLAVAESYLAEGRYFWNSGLFLWHVRTLEAAFRTYTPALADLFDRMSAAFYTPDEQRAVDALYPECQSISIDYAVMEKASDLYVCPADFGWSDLGTWGSLHTLLPKDECDNASVGDRVKLVDSRHCIVHVPSGKRVVVEGLDGYIVAERDGTLLICRLQDEQHIKEFSR